MCVNRLAPVVVARFMATQMGVNKRCAQRRGLHSHRQPDRNQLPEHIALLG